MYRRKPPQRLDSLSTTGMFLSVLFLINVVAVRSLAGWLLTRLLDVDTSVLARKSRVARTSFSFPILLFKES